MSYVLNLITGPTTEPVSLEEAKNYIKQDADIINDDDLIDDFIQHGREAVEAYCHRALISQIREVVYSCQPSEVVLPLGQLITVNKVTVIDEDGTENEQSTSLYSTTLKTDMGRVWLNNTSTWRTTERRFDHFVINFTCGWADADAVPAKFKTAIKKIVAYMDANREYNDDDVYLLIQQSMCGKLNT